MFVNVVPKAGAGAAAMEAPESGAAASGAGAGAACANRINTSEIDSYSDCACKGPHMEQLRVKQPLAEQALQLLKQYAQRGRAESLAGASEYVLRRCTWSSCYQRYCKRSKADPGPS